MNLNFDTVPSSPSRPQPASNRLLASLAAGDLQHLESLCETVEAEVVQ